MSETSGQISMEYLMILGFVTFIIGVIVVISSMYSKGVEDTVNTNQIDAIAKEIVDKAESIYYFGEPSRTTIRVYFPKGINSITLPSPMQINFNVRVHGGNTDVWYPSAVPMRQGSPWISTNPGYQNLIIEADTDASGGFVWINHSG